ncbi:MAG: hypothetical protein ACRDJM_04920 [Actinomycetota bacterium]
MRLRLVTICVLGALIASPARAGTTDWVLLKLTVGAVAGGVSIRIDGKARPTGGHAAVAGGGFGSDAGGSILVGNAGANPLRLQSTKGAGGLSVEILPSNEGPEFSFSVFIIGGIPMDPGETIEELFFIANGEITKFTTTVVTAPEGAESAARSGNGSAALPIADPSNGGIAVAFGEVVAGAAARSEQTARAIAGGIVWTCSVCSGDWHAPDGRSGDWTGVFGAAEGSLTFAGPAGHWAWTWSGESHQQSLATLAGEPVFGAYAPIGDDWVFFRHDA